LSPLRKNHLQVQTDNNALPQILEWFSQLYEPQVPRQIWLRCELAFAEGFTNVVKHAHKGKPPEVPIDLEVTVSEQSIEIRIWDYGEPFDLEEKLKQMLRNQDHDRDWGRGLILMYRIADFLTYTRTADNNGNCLLIVKYYNGDSGSSQRKITDFN
jgi:serine/threonine-protein kinase RsbW